MLIGGLQKFTVLDYPEKVAATIFTVGCNFRCPYCHNPELVFRDEFDEREAIQEKYLMDFLKSRVGDLDGICISGGEPTLQSDLIDFISKIKKLGFLVKLDTNGSNFVVVKEILEKGLVDYFAIDVKTSFENYELVGASRTISENVLNSIDLITNKGISLELRTTVVPGVVSSSDFDKVILSLSDKNKNILKNIYRYSIQSFRPQKTLDDNFSKVLPYEDSVLEEISDKLKNHCGRVDIIK